MKQEFIAAGEEAEAPRVDRVVAAPDWERNMASLANQGQVSIPSGAGLSRTEIVGAFTDAFELIGGTARLAIWADSHETEFYKLFSKLMPRKEETQHTGDVTVRHILPRGPLDT